MLEINEFKQRDPFSDFSEPNVTKGKNIIFFNNSGLKDLK